MKVSTILIAPLCLTLAQASLLDTIFRRDQGKLPGVRIHDLECVNIKLTVYEVDNNAGLASTTGEFNGNQHFASHPSQPETPPQFAGLRGPGRGPVKRPQRPSGPLEATPRQFGRKARRSNTPTSGPFPIISRDFEDVPAGAHIQPPIRPKPAPPGAPQIQPPIREKPAPPPIGGQGFEGIPEGAHIQPPIRPKPAPPGAPQIQPPAREKPAPPPIVARDFEGVPAGAHIQPPIRPKPAPPGAPQIQPPIREKPAPPIPANMEKLVRRTYRLNN
ncbi:hypothetical protein TWF106_000021 [Orbilia oligospora]|uniref:Uncharacterized protein n=1 Tax=Orbilia oligospora TaxID=2813651 RepID=A0A7C8VDY6_ORBOL|nr:hypothetical protein TWF106_000021 [Orbilia oligospora]